MYYKLKYLNGNYIEEIVKGYDFDQPNSMSKLHSLQYQDKSHLNFEKLKYPINLDWNDYVGCVNLNSNFSALISVKFLEIISKFKIVNHSVVDTNVVGPMGTHKAYKILLLNQGVGEFIDYNHSEFYLFKEWNLPEEECTVDNQTLVDFINCVSQFEDSPMLRSRKIVMTKEFDFDLFSVFGFGGGILVSERLKNEIEKSNLSGMLFRPSIVHSYNN